MPTHNKSLQMQETFSFKVKLCDSPDDEPLTIVVYDWFTREGTPPRTGNQAVVLVDGDQTWADVYKDMQVAKKDIRIATWLCRPNMELVRPEADGVSEPADREHYRFVGDDLYPDLKHVVVQMALDAR